MRKPVVSLSEGERHEFEWGSITWLHSGAFSGSEELTVGAVTIKSGQCNPVHAHPNCEEVLYLLEGELEHSYGDGPPYRLKPGDAICIPRGVRHNARSVGGQDARTVVSFSSADRRTQGE